MNTLSIWVFSLYAGMSAVTAVAYAWDKSRARRGGRRVSEQTLHLMAALGGWPGAALAQRACRHKTRKASFQAVFWLTVAAHLAFWAWLLIRRYA
ncbi:MAG: DUF1294 domain-containing protein [Sulfuricellaceae bacterium]|nr:DUF1294 domain-containing protein [Sulfuricellaceae bacterium]